MSSSTETTLGAKVLVDFLNFRSSITTGKPLSILKKDDIIYPTGKAWIEAVKDGITGWVSFEYIDYIDVAQVPIVISKPIEGEPIWLTWAKNQLGVKEVPGVGDNPTIQAWYYLTTLPEDLWHDSTAWCAVFVNAGFFLNGIKGTRSARAVDWLNFGIPVNNPEPGDIVVFDWQDGNHHVAYFLSKANGMVNVIGGNQSDAVTEASYNEKYVMGYRRPA